MLIVGLLSGVFASKPHIVFFLADDYGWNDMYVVISNKYCINLCLWLQTKLVPCS